MPSIKLLLILGAIAASLLGAGQTYRQLSMPQASATIVRRSTQERYDPRAKKMMNEHCLELAFEADGKPIRASYCSWDQHLENQMVVRYDPANPNSATPGNGTDDWVVTPLLWGLGPFLGWLAIVMFGYLPLYDRFGTTKNKRRARK